MCVCVRAESKKGGKRLLYGAAGRKDAGAVFTVAAVSTGIIRDVFCMFSTEGMREIRNNSEVA